MVEQTLIPQLFKTEYRKIISVLCKLFGIEHIEIAEDIANETFLKATESWGLKGIPENPVAWLYTVAKNKTKDYFKRNNLYNKKILVDLKRSHCDAEEIEIDLSAKNITDSQLQMMFAVCNPVIPVEAQVGLALRILCGFGIDEISDAFLTNKETINKRLFRAKEKLRTENVAIELPPDADIDSRLETVLITLYLLFNEGYHSNSTQTKTVRKELCIEAMRLTYLLIENEKTNKPIVNALMSLMCFHASRFEARVSDTGENILYEEQDRNLWNDELIHKGNHYLVKSATGHEISKYHIEASIAYWHCTKNETSNKWESILQLYNQLLQIDYSPIVALNRTYALSKANGKMQAIREALKLNLENNYLYFVLLGNLFTDVDNKKAVRYYQSALALVKTNNSRCTIEKHIKNLTPQKAEVQQYASVEV